MKHFGRMFEELLYRKGYTQKEVGERLGLSHVTVTRMKRQESVDAALLEKVARIFHVPVTLFFDGDVAYGRPEPDGAEPEVGVQLELLKLDNAHLKAIVAEKERLIKVLLKDKA